MKIEKINENQIRCTLSHNDLASRQLKLSELAYGSEKAKSLFREMMEQASYEYGFEAEDIPLMIEAVPLSGDCIVLTITKVEDPEELDTRFSKFAPSVHDDYEDESYDDDFEDVPLDEVMDLFQKVQKSDSGLFSDKSIQSNLPGAQNRDYDSSDALTGPSTSDTQEAPLPSSQTSKKENNSKKSSMQTKEKLPSDVVVVDYRVCEFQSMDHAIRFAHIVSDMKLPFNSLYKDSKAGIWKLIIENKDIDAEDFNKLCNIASEYGYILRHKSVPETYYTKHCELFCKANAIQSLARI